MECGVCGDAVEDVVVVVVVWVWVVEFEEEEGAEKGEGEEEEEEVDWWVDGNVWRFAATTPCKVRNVGLGPRPLLYKEGANNTPIRVLEKNLVKRKRVENEMKWNFVTYRFRNDESLVVCLFFVVLPSPLSRNLLTSNSSTLVVHLVSI